MAPGRPREFDTDDALDAATQVFIQRGYEAARLPELLEAMKIGRQSMYNAFGDKRRLFLKVLDRYAGRHQNRLDETLGREGCPLENVRQVVAGWNHFAEPGSHCGCLTANTMAELGHTDPDVAAVLRRQVGRLESAFADTLTSAKAHGGLRECVDPRRLARHLTTTFYGIALMSRLPDTEPIVRDAVAAALCTLQSATRSG